MQPVLPAAEQLWKQFTKLAQDVIELADPKESHLSALGPEHAFDRALKGLKLLSSHNCAFLAQSLSTWIKNTGQEIAQKYRSTDGFLANHGVCKRAAMWILAFEAGVQVLDSLQPQDLAKKEVAALCEQLLSEAVKWMTRTDEMVPRHPPYELAATRQQVAERAAKVMGAMSHVSLQRVLDCFLATLKEKLPQKKDSARDQAIALCGGMRHVVLSLDSDPSVAAATAFIERCNPLVHLGAKNKSQVQHAICGMLTAVLAPLVREGPPPGWQGLRPDVRAAWYSVVNDVREGLSKWVNKNAKHIQDGYPLMTALVCLADNKRYAELVDGTADLLLRQMRQKEWRLVCLRCLNQLLGSYLGRYMRVMPLPEIHKWLDRCTRPVVLNFKKGNLLPDHQEVIYNMCIAIAEHHPRYALEEVVADLLQPDPLDCAHIALRALLGIVLAPPGRISFSTARLASSLAASTAARLPANKQPPQARQVLDLMRKGQHPLDAPDVAPAVPKLHSALTRLLAMCHAQLGAYPLFGAEALPREKAALAPIMVGLLQVMPFLKPHLWIWPNAVPLKELPGYTAHLDGGVRQLAVSVMQQMMRGCPLLRNTLLMQLASFITTVPDDSLKVMHESLSLMRKLLDTWLEVLREAAAGGEEPGEVAVREAVLLDAPRLEGVLLAILCHHDDTTRREALLLLRLVRDLHRTLAATLAGLQLEEGDRPPLEPLPPVADHERRSSCDSLYDTTPLPRGQEAEAVYVADVVEEAGEALAAGCYWDFWDWGDLWRAWKAVPPDVSFEGVLLATDETAKLRRARLLGALVGAAAPLCPGAVAVAYAEANTRLARLMTRDYNGRLMPPSEGSEAKKLEAWGCYAALTTAAPPACTDRVDKSARSKAALPHRELLQRALLPVVSQGGSYVQQAAAVLALGNLHPDHLDRLLEELPSALDRFLALSRQRGKVKPEEVSLVRSSVANIYRIAASNLPPQYLEDHPPLKAKLLAWMLEAARQFSPTPPPPSPSASTSGAAPFSEQFWDLVQVAYSLCSVATSVAPAMVRELSQPASALRRITLQGTSPGPPSQGGVPFRKQLFELFAAWCDQGTAAAPDGGYQAALSAGISAAVARARDGDSGEAVRGDLALKADHLDAAARLAMAAMLQGPAFDTDARRSQGPVLGWLDRLLEGPLAMAPPRLGPSRGWVAHRALRSLLEANTDLFPTAINRCYHQDPHLAKAYFRVLVEVYTAQAVQCEPHVLLSLILTKLVSPDRQVREDALHLLHVLEHREWSHGPEGPPSPPALPPSTPFQGGEGSKPPPTVVLGLLQDSYQQFLYHLSRRLAREHPELSESLCEEMMTRQLDGSDQVTQHPVLTCLAPWMDNLAIAQEWEGTWAARLLKSCYLLTLSHGHQYPAELEGLWSTLARNKRNISPVLHYLISFGMHSALQDLTTMLDYFGVAKRISLYLARVSPQQTVDQLVLEMAQQALDDGPPTSPRPPPGPEAPHFSALLAAAESDSNTSLQFLAQGSTSLSTSASLGLRVSSRTGGELSGSVGASSTTIKAFHKAASFAPQRSDSASSRSSAFMATMQAAANPSTPPHDSISSSHLHLSLRSRVADSTQSVALSQHSSVQEPHSPALRPLLARPELAMCLLAEVAYEQREALQPHLALVLHLAVLLGDHEEAQVAGHSQQLLLNLMYSLAAHHGGGGGQHSQQQGGEGEGPDEVAAGLRPDASQAAAVIQHLQCTAGRQLWPHEDASMERPHLPSTSALQHLTSMLLAALPFEPDLSEVWAAQALRWALTARCRHLSSRSFQVYRALAPPLTVDASCSLLCCLQQCLASPAADALQVAVEPLLTLQQLVAACPPALLPLYPHLFWAAISLLFTDSVPLFARALPLFSTLLSSLPLSSPTTLHTLLVAAPQAASATAITHLTSSALLLSAPDPSPDPSPTTPNPFLPTPQPPPYAAMPPSAPLNPFVTSQALSNPPLPPDLLTSLPHVEPWYIGQALMPPLADTPPYPTPRLLCIQHLLLKGLAAPTTLLPTLRALTTLTRHLAATHPPSAAASRTSGASPHPPPLPLRSREAGLHQRVAEALLGPHKGQLFTTLAGCLPYLCCTLAERPPPRPQDPATHKEREEVEEAAEELLVAVGAACRELGLPVLGQRVERLREASDWGALEGALANLCLQLTRAFFPQYAPWLLCRCVDLLTAPAPEALHRAVLHLLRALFTVQDLQLGAAMQLLTGSSLLHPLVAMAQGGLSPLALEALDAVLSYCSASRHAPGGPRPLPEVPLDVEACCAHSSDIATALQQVLDTTGAASRLGRLKLLPHVPRPLGPSSQYEGGGIM